MRLLPKKINKIKVAGVLLDIAFWLLLGYQVFVGYQLYSALKTNKDEPMVKHVVRIDFNNMQQAVTRYKDAQNFSLPAPIEGYIAPDPFANNVTIPEVR